MTRLRNFLMYFYFTMPTKAEDGEYVMRLGDEERRVSQGTAVMIKKYAMIFMLLMFFGLGALPTENANFPLEIAGTVAAALLFCLLVRFLATR
jgi:hypothetical protein